MRKSFRRFVFLGGILLAGGIYWLFSGGEEYGFLFQKPLISVVMPTYNREDLLPRAIESILNQTYKNFEFIIVDDGSTDNSAELIKVYQKQDPRIRFVKNDRNRGISYSRNRGMDLACGKYLAIMDSDDFSTPDRLEKSLSFFKKHPDYTAVNSVYYEMGKEGINNWVPPKRWEIIFNFSNYYTNLALIDLDFVRKHSIRYDESLISGEDYDFWAKMFMSGGKLGMVNEPLVYLRRHRTHSRAYYENIVETRRVVSARLLARFGITKEEVKSLSQCDLMKKMSESKEASKYVDMYVLNLTYNRQCTELKLPDGTLYVKAFDFVDHFLPAGKNIYTRQNNGELYQVVSQHGKEIVFLNPAGKHETYRLMDDGSYGLIEDLN